MNLIFYNNCSKKIFFYLVFINIYQVVITRAVNKIKDLDLDYIHPIALLNGNIFIIHKNGVLVYNYNFTVILYNYNFGGIPIISSEEESELTSVIQCKDNDKNVFVLINDTIYAFSSRGLYLFDKQINSFSDYRTDVYFKYFSFLYYKYKDSNYYLIVAFINNDSKIKFVQIQVNIQQQNCESGIFFYNIRKPISDSVSCQIINFNDYSDKLVCIYAVKDLIINAYSQEEETNKAKVSLFNPEDNFNLLNQTNIENIFFNEHYIFKSIITDRNKGLLFIDFLSKSDTNLKYIILDLNNFNIIGGIKYPITCSSDNKFIMADYNEYTKQYIFSCLNNNGVSMYKFKYYDSETDNLQETADYGNCNYFYNYNFIFLLYEGSYFLINNFNCNNSKVQVYNLNTIISINDYIIPSDEPDNSYIYSPTLTKTSHIKIPTTIPKTTHIKIPTTIPKTTHIKIPTTIPKTTFIKIPTTIPKTTFIKMPTTIPKTTHIKIQITIPKTTYIKIQTTIPKTTHIKTPKTIPKTTLIKIPTTISRTTLIIHFTTNPKLEYSTIPSTKISTTSIKSITPTTIKQLDSIIPTKATLKTTQIITIPKRKMLKM